MRLENGGRTGIFSESGWIAEVEILENSSDATCYRYKLKVIKTLRPPPRFTASPDGTVFSVYQMKNEGAWAGMWSLKHSEPQVDSLFPRLRERLTGFIRRFRKENES